jgi:signal transduction histidine kinase
LQTANEQALDEARASAARERLAEVARGLEVAVFEPLGEERLRLVSRAPEWLERQCPGLEPGDALEARAISDYAADFLVTELHAALGGGRIQRASLPWTEEVPGTGLMSRECVVGRTPSGRRFFLVRRLGLDLVDRSAPIQAGRDLGLLYERLSREIEEKDILLHGIFHDLSNPLTNVINAVELLEGSLSAEEEELRAIALDESLRQRTVLRTLLEVFRAERLVHEPDPPETAGLLSGIQTLRSGLELAAKLRGLELAFELPEQEMTVIGDAIRLERIIQNLAENAFRVSPAGGRVRVGAEAREDRALVYVEDEGPGVPEVDRAVIFDKLRRGGDGGGKLGLGLYFCRLTARRWGGEVRHANLEPRGSRFEVELVRADPPARPRPGGTG